MDTFDSFSTADAAAADHEQVCGTYIGEKPVYYLLPRDASDDEIRDAAFEVRNGRAPSSYELFLLATAAQMREDLPA
jgi:hypothetical protein